MKWLILIVGIFSNASASVLIKLAVMPPREFPSLKNPMVALMNWPFWLGIVLYGGAFLIYAIALTRFPLNVAHPILTAGAVAMVAVFSTLFFREPLYWSTIAGFILVIAGVALITIKVV